MSRTPAGRFTKGASGNPSGIAKAKRPPGSDDVVVYSGYVSDPEPASDLNGARKWPIYQAAFHRPPVAIRALLQHALFSGIKWTAVENDAGGRDAIRGREIVEQGLLYARLPVPWPETFAKASMSWFFGSSLHATSMGRRKDGMVVYTDIAHRPMHTIQQWIRQADDRPFEAVEQRTRDGKTITIPLDECFYVVEKMLSDDPYGIGSLRLVVERIRRAGNYEKLEGSELFGSMAGTPIYRAPIEEINAAAQGSDDAAAYKSAKLSAIKEAVANRIKSPERQMYLGLDSAVYTGQDPNTITGIKKWDIEILKGEIQGLTEIRKVISDLDLDVARIMGVELVLVGGNDGAGSFGMHESKVNLLQSTLQALSSRNADRATQQLARRLVAANGLDPDTACPYLVPEKITTSAVLDVVSALEGLTRAGLHPSDPAKNIIRERLELPPEPEQQMADLMAPRRAPVPDIADAIEPAAPEVTDAAPKEPGNE